MRLSAWCCSSSALDSREVVAIYAESCRVLEASSLRPTLRSSQPWVPSHARQQRGSRKHPPPTSLDPPDAPEDAPESGTALPNGAAKQALEKPKDGGEASTGKSSSRGRGRGRSGSKRKAGDAGEQGGIFTFRRALPVHQRVLQCRGVQMMLWPLLIEVLQYHDVLARAAMGW